MTAGRLDSGLRVTRSTVIDRRYRNLAVGILGGEKSAFLRGHVAADVIENIPGDRLEKRIARDLKRFEIRDGQLRLVIEHFFEMWDMPEAIHGVAVKAAAQMIVYSSGRHLAECEKIHFERVFAAG